MFELLAGIVVTLLALAMVLEPLLRPATGARVVGPAPMEEGELGDLSESESPKVQALLALKEIEFDRATGKLSDEDYALLKARYAAAALDAMKAEDVAAAAVAAPAAVPAAAHGGDDDAAEALVRRFKRRGQDGSLVCPTCGPRPEPDAVFCSTCGRSLLRAQASPRCHHCGAATPEGSKFCAGCGGRLAA
jgi:primosomal protein N'